MTARAEPVQQRYQRLVQAIEDRFEVAGWRSGDIDLWPPARTDLFLDMFRQDGGDTAPPTPALPLRALGALATPLINLWKSRGDLAHWAPWPRPAHAVLLGDGVSLDRIGGAWRDRHGEPVIAALERQGRTTLLMQPGDLTRLPWLRPTYPANLVAARGAISAALDHGRAVDLPDHAAVLALLEQNGVDAPSLSRPRQARRARSIAGAACQFQRVLRAVRPSLAFVVTCYSGLGHAFALACRREGVMGVDLQHCPQEGTHRAYSWRRAPARGFSTLPAVFWTWTPEEAAHVDRWADGRAAPWHRGLHGGHSQLLPFLDDRDSDTLRWDERFSAIGDASRFDREILVALQPIGGRRATWEALARQIETSPATWRWWIRRHPSSTLAQDGEYRGLLALRRSNVLIDEASALPLPALLRHMSALVSLASGAAAEAAAFGVPALFLDDEARGTFAGLIERGQAEVIGVVDVVDRLSSLPASPARPAPREVPPIDATLRRLEAMAGDYRRLCRETPLVR